MRIDCHVHFVGTGADGTGCWYRPKGLTKIGEPFLVKAIGLTTRDLHGPEFDRLYTERLLEMIRGSSVDRALLLFGEGRTLEGPVEAVLTAESLSRLYGHPLREMRDGGARYFVPG